MKKKIYEAEMFIIPNSIYREEGSEYDYWWKGIDAKFEKYFGKEFAERDRGNRKLVQIWICSDDGSDNWTDHGCPIDNESFPGWLPSWLIRDMKEGDTIEIDLPKFNAVLKLTAAQLKYRYKGFGKFEDVLERIGA